MGNREYRKLKDKADKKAQDVVEFLKEKLASEDMNDFDDDDFEEEENKSDNRKNLKKGAVNTSPDNSQISLMSPAVSQTCVSSVNDKVRITMLGTSSSGKSSFLSGVHQTLISDHLTKLYLSIDDDPDTGAQHASIESIVMVKDDKITGFMTTGTTETKSYDLILSSEGKEYCKFEFWDYRGALVNAVPLGRTESMEVETIRFREHLKKSDVILVFADSIRISQYLNVAERRIQTQANLMNNIFTNILGKKKYHIILVLTKSDDSYVREEDKKNNFCGLCEKAIEVFGNLRDHAKTFAVIPVSAVGEGNAETVEEIHKDEDKIVKSWKAKLRGGAIPEPENIDLVIMYACRDILIERLRELQRELEVLRKSSDELERGIRRLNRHSKKYKGESAKWNALAAEITKKEDLFRNLKSDIQDISDVFEEKIETYVYYEKKD